MRAPLLCLLLVLPAFVGCIAAETPAFQAAPLDPLALEVPDGAELVQEAGRTILRFAEVEFPFETTITVPEGATIVRARATVPGDLIVTTTMSNEETGRRRCNPDLMDAWDVSAREGRHTCSGLAAIDPPGASWLVRAGVLVPQPHELDLGLAEPVEPVTGTVEVVFETTPLDGPVARLDLSQLSMPAYDVTPTQYLQVPSFDGTKLWVEVTLPDGEGPWPTIISSDPYNGQFGRGEEPANWEYWTHDWVKRGYAAVNADVRGFGMSGGCVEVWGPNEQRDQAFLVDWVAQQSWSDGSVGFYGQSYVGTTPVEASVQAPEALKAIVTVAPVINAYHDWHFGGVPNGESTGSPRGYQTRTDPKLQQDPSDPVFFLEQNLKGVCDPTLVVRANDPRAIYDAFYEERNFSARAKDVKAAVLYTQGFEDRNVKSAMIPGWFNELTSPKLGLFGHWVHQHPTRADEEILFLGWMDQYVKGKPLGFENVGPVEVVLSDETYRVAREWPATDAAQLALQADFAGGKLGQDAQGDGQLLLMPWRARHAEPVASAVYTLEFPVEEDLAFSGTPRFAIEGMLMNGGNAYFHAELFDVGDEKTQLVTYGMFNLAHRDGHDTWSPAAPAETVRFELPFLPTEWILREGHTLRVVLTGTSDRAFVTGQPGTFMLHGGEASRLLLDTVDLAEYAPTPMTATR